MWPRSHTSAHALPIPSPAPQERISQEDLDELEAAEEWVATMAGLEEEESLFMIDLALSSAEPARVAEIERSCARQKDEPLAA